MYTPPQLLLFSLGIAGTVSKNPDATACTSPAHSRACSPLPGSASHCALCLRIVQGLLSDPNIDPVYLGILVMVGASQNKFKPSVKAIKELYYQKFRGKGGEQ